MILPVVAYGLPILRKKAIEIDKNFPKLQELIENMYETMYAANGVGLAAPQINQSIRLIVIDAPSADKEEKTIFKKVLINPLILKTEGEEWAYNEGCLSIPDIHEDVFREAVVHIQYYDENFKFFQETYSGIIARIIQHEYDHIEGKLFVDHLTPLKKMLLKRKLQEISSGEIETKYKMIFPHLKKKR